MAKLAVQLSVICTVLVMGLITAARALPRGGQLAFVSVRDGNFEVYLLDTDRAIQYNLSSDRNRDDSPTWSPDGRRLAFVSYRGGDAQIYTADPNTGKIRAITNLESTSLSPEWSPDSQQIAFVSNRSGRWSVYLIDADCEGDCEDGVRELPVSFPRGRGSMGKPDWSPDGRYIAVAINLPTGIASVHLIDTATGDLSVLPSQLIDTRLSWSADSSLIAYTSISDRNLEVYALNPFERVTRNISQFLGYDGLPSWSPDGQNLVFESSREGMVEIFRMSRDGEDIERMTDGGPSMRPVWSPDGRQITFESARDRSFDIYVLDVSSGDVRRLTTDPADDRFAAWRPG